MKKERGFIAKLFCEGNEPSSKRFVGIIGAITLFSTLFIDVISSDVKPLNETLINAIAFISFGALGITGAEKIFSKKTQDKTE